MSNITLNVVNDTGCYRPGDTVEGDVSWELEGIPRSIEARLFWYTRGKGTTDTEIVATESFTNLTPTGDGHFSLSVPVDAVFSYTGKLMSVLWAVEIIAEKKLGFARRELVVSPTGAALVPPAEA